MTEANNDLVQEIMSMSLREALGKLTDGLTQAEMAAATNLEKRIDKSAYKYDEETGTPFASKVEHRQVALAALSLAIDAMVHGSS
jgi:hypothetical protein